MPRKTISYRNGSPLDPAEYISLVLPSCESLQFAIFVDDATNRELVRCDICGRFCPLTSKRSMMAMKKHRGKNECSKKVQRKDRNQMQDQVNAEAHAALCALFQTNQAAPRTPPLRTVPPRSTSADPTSHPAKVNVADHSKRIPDVNSEMLESDDESEPSSSPSSSHSPRKRKLSVTSSSVVVAPASPSPSKRARFDISSLIARNREASDNRYPS